MYYRRIVFHIRRRRPAAAVTRDVTPVPHAGMKPKDNPTVICEELTSARDRAGAMLLVGHLPHLARLAGLMLADDAEKRVVEFVHAGVVKLRPTESGWALAGYITPACVR